MSIHAEIDNMINTLEKDIKEDLKPFQDKTTFSHTLDRYEDISKFPKNLAEVVKNVLKNIEDGKISNLEQAIMNLRVSNYPSSHLENGQKIVFLNFEDDTFRIILGVEITTIKTIQSWYDECNIMFDVEETDIIIPLNISNDEMNDLLLNDISCKDKEKIVFQYIPMTINNILCKKEIENVQQMFNNTHLTDSIKLIEKGWASPNLINFHSKPITEINEKKTDIIKKLEFDIPPLFSDNNNKSHNNKSDLPPLFSDNNNKSDIFFFSRYPSEFKPPYEEQVDLSGFKPYETGFLYPKQSWIDACAPFDFIHCETVDNILVLVHDKFFKTLVIKNPTNQVKKTLEEHPEFGFRKLFHYKTNNTDVLNIIKTEFHKVNFYDIKSINDKLQVISKYVEFLNKQNVSNNYESNEELQVKKYINYRFKIDNDINNKMKASVLHDIICNSGYVKIEETKLASFKTRLSQYLKDLGLQKKRYNDGYYYYGIIDRELNTFSPITNIRFNEMLLKRTIDENSYEYIPLTHSITDYEPNNNTASLPPNEQNNDTASLPPNDINNVSEERIKTFRTLDFIDKLIKFKV